MTAITKTHHTRTRARMTTYWIATGLLVAELTLGGIWDVLRIPLVRNVVTHLGYPTYFLVLLGTWKLLGAAALLVPRLPLVKEWAYAGVFFVFSGAIVSHLTTGKDVQEVAFCSIVLILTVASWALRPATRTLHERAHDQNISVTA
jgi:DoxX-like protein